QSCLFLTDADRLAAQTLLELDLSPYRLVSLAACETAVTGNQTITDEYVGLVSAFLKAGASCIVSTLWKVESAASALLMVEFYRQLLAGRSPVVALKTAQTWLCRATREELLRWLDEAIDLLREDKANRLTLEDIRDEIAEKEEGERPYGNPYYWAAFVVAGRC
ncbi:MAG: CHAT domain-containing protein, partial [Cyanobacteriota bacterium]|nr:CHAT domain-containing protein [Cyanobacteriota bacterium]